MALMTSFARGATFIIAGPNHLADVNDGVSNNVESGTSVGRGQRTVLERSSEPTLQDSLPEREEPP